MIFLVIALAVILRLINLDQSLWLDEATQVLLSQESIYSIIFQRGVDFHPPLSYLLMHFWMKLGISEIWLRILSVIFGVATVWITYKLTKEMFNKYVAILSAILLSISQYHSYYSQEVRMYSEATFFAALSIYFLYLFLINNNKMIYSIGYILSTTALLYTHYDGFFLISAQFLYILFTQKKQLKKFVSYLVAVFLLLLPWMPQFIIQLKNGFNSQEYLPGWSNILSLPFYKAIPVTFLKFSFGRIDIENTLPFLILIVSILTTVFLILFKSLKNIKDENYKLVMLWFFIPIISALIISFKIPLNQPFRILYVLPAFCILLAMGINTLGKFRKTFLVLVMLISVSGLTLYYSNPRYSREDWRGATEYVVKNSTDRTAVLFAWSQPFSPYQWYVDGKYGQGIVSKFPATRIEVETNLKNIDNKNEIYLFEYLQALSDPQKVVQQVLKEKGFTLNRIYDFQGVGFIDHYVK